MYEIAFYVGNTEDDMDVDMNSGMVTDFDVDYSGGYGAPNDYGNEYYYDDEF